MHDPIRSGLTSLFADAPEMAFELSERMGGPALSPRAVIRSAPRTLVDPLDPSRRLEADLVLVAYDLVDGARVPVSALAIEVVLARDESRVSAWELVPRALYERYGCYGKVIVVSPDPDLRAWIGARVSPSCSSTPPAAYSN